MTPVAYDKLTAKGKATRERIVAAASELMLLRGVARTTIEDIQQSRGHQHLADVSLLRRQGRSSRCRHRLSE